MDSFINFIDTLDGYLGGYVLVYLLLGAGLFFTFRLGFVQIQGFFRGFKLMFGDLFAKDESGSGALSSFQALSTAIAAQVGTGNVGGVATAISMGGPGAVFWMWITAILGMPTIFAEAVLAQAFRRRDESGDLLGGPAYYLSRGLKNKGLGKFLAGFFAVAIIFALGLSGNMVQSNSIADALNNSFGIPTWIIGIVLAVLAALIFMGGVDRIGRFAELVVPFMAIIYIIGSIVLLVKFKSHLGTAFGYIFTYAFTPAAAIGGFSGAVVRQTLKLGVQRGLFSNEAGMGSTPHAHAVAFVDHPAEQGYIAMIGVFIDTLLVCSATALAILATESFTIEGLEGVRITQEAFNIAFGNAGGMFLSICLMFFAFTTIIGWYYFAETNVRYLFGNKGLTPYRIAVIASVVFGAVAKVEFVWVLNGFLNNLMVIPNMIGVLILSPLVVYILRDYKKQTLAGKKLEWDYDHIPDYGKAKEQNK